MADSKKGYGSKPWWFWVLVYVVIGAVVYYLIYYFTYAKKGYNYNSVQPAQDTESQMYK